MLLLVPSPLSQETPRLPILQADLDTVHRCTNWLVETPKAARAAIAVFKMPVPTRELNLLEMAQIEEKACKKLLLESSLDKPVAVMSDAGCPGIADPGAQIVQWAHEVGVMVVPLVGPSSVLMGLMASGLNGQTFQFYGYPPVQPAERDLWIVSSEKKSRSEKSTQLVIETPFRNQRLFDALCTKLSINTKLCVAQDLTGAAQFVKTQTVGEWRTQPKDLGKHPTLFLWLAA